MKSYIYLPLILSACLLGATPHADKSEMPGKSQAAIEKSAGEDSKAVARSKKDKMSEKADEAKGRAEEKSAKGLEKAESAKKEGKKRKAETAEDAIKEFPNNSDKTDAIRKEAGKGSEQGQQKREEKSRKWWKFWE